MLRQARQLAHLSRTRLSQLTGISLRRLIAYEAEQRPIDIDHLRRLAKFLPLPCPPPPAAKTTPKDLGWQGVEGAERLPWEFRQQVPCTQAQARFWLALQARGAVSDWLSPYALGYRGPSLLVRGRAVGLTPLPCMVESRPDYCWVFWPCCHVNSPRGARCLEALVLLAGGWRSHWLALNILRRSLEPLPGSPALGQSILDLLEPFLELLPVDGQPRAVRKG